MKAQIKSLFWKLVCTIGGLTLLLTIIQGICNYFFVTQYAANKDIIQADLIKKQTEKLITEMKNSPKIDELQLKLLERSIDKLEKEIIKLDSRSEEILKKITIKEKGGIIEKTQLDTMKNLTPSLEISSEPPVYADSKQISFSYSFKNIGQYSTSVEIPRLYLATTNMKQGKNDKIINPLIINKDYILEDDLTTCNLSPGEVENQHFKIKLVDPQKIPNKIYFKIVFFAETDDKLIKSLKNIKKEEIIYKKVYSVSGSIVKLINE